MSVAEEYGFRFDTETCIEAPFRRFPCRKCIPCLLARQKAWVSRLTEELQNHDENYFVTLTYDEVHVPIDEYGEMCFNRQHLIKLNRDIRKRYQQGYLENPVKSFLYGSPEKLELPKGVRYKYYITSEYGPGGTHRPHYHAVWYGLQGGLDIVELLFRTLWPYGFVSVFPAKDGAAGYISKYLVTDGIGKQSYQSLDNGMRPFALMSKGLGLSYADRMGDFHRADSRRMYVQKHGVKSRMDRYLKHKIFSEDVLEEVAEKYKNQQDALHVKYAYFQSDHPALYRQLMAERNAFFEEQKRSIKWNQLKKHKL